MTISSLGGGGGGSNILGGRLPDKHSSFSNFTDLRHHERRQGVIIFFIFFIFIRIFLGFF